MSPELLDPEQLYPPTKESDCYALGMVIYEVLTGQVPFAPLKDLIVIQMVIKGEHPQRLEGEEGAWFTDDLWEMLNMCWEAQPRSRPSVEIVFTSLQRASEAWKLSHCKDLFG